MGQGATSNRRERRGRGDTLHDGLVKLRSLVGKLRETAGTWYSLRKRDWLTGVDWGLVDLGLVELGLVDLGHSWGVDWRLAQEVRRRGELVHLLGFLATTHTA